MPAGMLYFRLDDPLIRCSKESTDEAIEKAIMKELRMKGLVLADVKLIKEMDSRINGDSLIIPARINKDGTLGRSSAATAEQFNVLRDYVRRILAEIGSGIIDGNVAINPYKKRTVTACTYCGFSSVCQFDTSIRDNRYRLIPDVSEDELWNNMKGAGSAAAYGNAEESEDRLGISGGAGQEGATDVSKGKRLNIMRSATEVSRDELLKRMESAESVESGITERKADNYGMSSSPKQGGAADGE
jgi:hypothetical protein